MNAKNTKKSQIHENADANITCDFGDGDISRFRSRLPHTRPDGHIVSSIIVDLMPINIVSSIIVDLMPINVALRKLSPLLLYY